jgi:hypothetical protein
MNEWLLDVEAAGRDGRSWEQTREAVTDGQPGGTALARQAYRLGLLQRLVAMGRDAVLATADAGQDADGARFVLAEMAIALTAARELVYQAGPDGVDVAVAAVASRDALANGLSFAATIVTAEQWPAFLELRATAEADLREDPAGANDLELVAAAALAGDAFAGVLR